MRRFLADVIFKAIGEMWFKSGKTPYARDSVTKKYFFPLRQGHVILACVMIRHAIAERKSGDTHHTKFENVEDNSKAPLFAMTMADTVHQIAFTGSALNGKIRVQFDSK